MNPSSPQDQQPFNQGVPQVPPSPQPLAPQPVPNQVPPQAPYPAPQQPAPQRPRKKILWWILGGVGALLLLIIAGVILLFIGLLSPKFQAQIASDSFMDALDAGDIKKAGTLSDTSDDFATFLKTYSDDAKGHPYKLEDSTQKANTYYFLYSTDNPKNKYARTSIAKTDGSYKVTSFVFSANKLALVPAAMDSSDTSSTTTDPATSSTATNCAAFGDYTAAFGSDALGNEAYWQPSDGYQKNVYFATDSLNYDDLSAQQTFASFGTFYKANPDKAYTIHLQGSVATTAQADLDFASQRANKVKAALISTGVSDAKIIIDAPTNVTSTYGGTSTDSDKEVARRVQIIVTPDSNC